MIKKYKKMANRNGIATVCGTRYQIIDDRGGARDYYVDLDRVTLSAFRRSFRDSLMKVSNELAKIPYEVRSKYNIQEMEGHGLQVHKPAFINIKHDSLFAVTVGKTTVQIRNKYVSVELWIDSVDGIMHTTVFDPLT